MVVRRAFVSRGLGEVGHTTEAYHRAQSTTERLISPEVDLWLSEFSFDEPLPSFSRSFRRESVSNSASRSPHMISQTVRHVVLVRALGRRAGVANSDVDLMNCIPLHADGKASFKL